MPRQTRHAERRAAEQRATATPARTQRAALYCRVSTDEQAERGYSLRDQEDRLRQWAAREGVDVSAVYVEEGASAKTFDRPQWTRLLAAIESGPLAPFDTVLVVKWDRFSRDATGALGMIRRLDARGVRVQATEQPIDPAVPEQLLMQVLYVAAPEVENRRRSLATKAGMRRAMREGRYVNVPPKGYLRGRDDQERYLIRPCPVQGPLVAEAFRLAASSDASLEELRRRLARAGLRCSKNQFTLLLRNPLYAGRIVIPAWGGEPEATVDGLHDALVTMEAYEAVQERRFRRTDNRSRPRRALVDEIPLRGHLLCPVALVDRGPVRLTGSGSRSRTGAKVWYYHGQGPGAVRFRADAAHEAFVAFLDTVSVPGEIAAVWRHMAAEEARTGADLARRRLREARAVLAETSERLALVEERYHVERAMEPDTYDRLRRRYLADADTARLRIVEAEGVHDHGAAQAAVVAALVTNLVDVWQRSGAAGRSALAGSIWPDGLVFDGESYRTTPASPVIALFRAGSAIMQDGEGLSTPAVLSGAPGRTDFEPEKARHAPAWGDVVGRAFAASRPLHRLVAA